MPQVRSQVMNMLERLHQIREEIHSLTKNLKDVSLHAFSLHELN
jgi:hypothetical protein